MNFQHPIFLPDSIAVMLHYYNQAENVDDRLETKNYAELNKTVLLLQNEGIFSYEELESRLMAAKSAFSCK